MLRSSAIAHETGHVVYAMHEHVELAYADISRVIVEGHPRWVGYTQWARPYPPALMLTNLATDPLRSIMSHICDLISGVVGECTLDLAGYRQASSLDEVVVAQVLCQQLSLRTEFQGMQPERLWQFCWRRTAAIIRTNEKLAHEVMAKLDAMGIVRRKQLAKLALKVCRLPDDPLAREWAS
jgi:hypothetical protein